MRLHWLVYFLFYLKDITRISLQRYDDDNLSRQIVFYRKLYIIN